MTIKHAYLGRGGPSGTGGGLCDCFVTPPNFRFTFHYLDILPSLSSMFLHVG